MSTEEKETKVLVEEKDEEFEGVGEGKIITKLKTLSQDPKNFLVTETFAIYRGNNVDYKQIKRDFPKIVKEKLRVSEGAAIQEAKNIAVFLNLGGFSSTRKNIVKVKEEALTLDELTAKLELTNFSKTSAKTTDRKLPTLTRVCIAYADETREAIKRKPAISRFPELGELGFVYSWACTGLSEEQVKRIYVKQLELVQTWTPSRTSNPKRFPEKMEIFYISVLNYPKTFFLKIKEDITRGVFT
jgi:hypothetical protein